MTLADKACAPCRAGVPPLTRAQIVPLAAQIPAWEVVDDHHVRRAFAFDDFAGALDFVNAVGAEAEAAGHHPDLELSWGSAVVTFFTHAIDGLHEADFVMAARCDRLYDARRAQGGHEHARGGQDDDEQEAT